MEFWYYNTSQTSLNAAFNVQPENSLLATVVRNTISRDVSRISTILPPQHTELQIPANGVSAPRTRDVHLGLSFRAASAVVLT